MPEFMMLMKSGDLVTSGRLGAVHREFIGIRRVRGGSALGNGICVDKNVRRGRCSFRLYAI